MPRKFFALTCMALTGSVISLVSGCSNTSKQKCSVAQSAKKCNIATADLSIIPQPTAMATAREEFFILDASTKIKIDKSLYDGAKFFVNRVSNAGFTPAVVTSCTTVENNSVVFAVDNAIGEEGYILEVTPKNVVIKASTAKGAFYATQSLRQMLPVSMEKEVLNITAIKIPAVKIADEPRFKWRGMMLDSCRHFTEVSDIKKIIDLMAMYKMNTFHWHLTEDQGWRLAIDKYPLLTEKGAFRKDTLLTHNRTLGKKDAKWAGKSYGNFYSKEEAKDIVKYAAERFITVIPEIELPGHSVAAVHAYPWLSCEGKDKAVWTRWGISDDIYCAGKESTFKFLEDVLTETMDIFPSKIIHIGGDEAKKNKWKKCQLCQKRIKDNNLKDEHELQSYFIKRINKFVQSKGREIIGWDEILEGGLAEGAMVMSWRGTRGGIKAAKMGHNVVMTPGSHCYFDHYQSKNKANEPLAIGGFTNVAKVYQFNPTNGLNKEEAKFIQGGQANVWHEYIRDQKYREYMIFPRLLALSEAVWTPMEKKNYDDFKKRLEKHYKRFDTLGVNYRRHDKK
ncbi:beta-N-acetylhexosaminidase [Lentisphaerota bacterium WC36G]|nr:beta-N-acetylhexosaminidase [Lentisphaerae bacterium WC36]